jgi:membrane-associated HD superfamily phosphohydrolase
MTTESFYDTTAVNKQFVGDISVEEEQVLSPRLANNELSDEKRRELMADLEETSDEINMLRQVLQSMIKHTAELKRKLGLTPWNELNDTLSNTVKSVKESEAFHKTEQVVHQINEKTTEAFSNLGKKLGEIRHSDKFKSFEDRVGVAYSSVKPVDIRNGRNEPMPDAPTETYSTGHTYRLLPDFSAVVQEDVHEFFI